jgi:hydroxypyruvate reductase
MTSPPQHHLRDDALAIWKAGVAAVDSARLVAKSVHAWPGGLTLAGRPWRARPDSRLCIVGAGKAGAGMAAGLEQALGPIWLHRASGWINVPSDCVHPLRVIHLHGARPPGLNEPTAAGVAGTREILARVQALRPQDLCLVLLSGGGSAMLPAPIEGITLEDKQQVTRLLMRSGADIVELNTVRRALSAIKGGGLLRACQAGRLCALIISDVIGDPLETIASGPTVDIPPDPKLAVEILQRFAGRSAQPIPERVVQTLQRLALQPPRHLPPHANASNHVIGNNHTAVLAAATAARRLGYTVVERVWDQPGVAADCGRQFAERLFALRQTAAPGARLCIVSGGETTVQVAATAGPQLGGRNQELALAAVDWLLHKDARGLALVSGGTDGEDGPTDAAGAMVDAALLESVRNHGVDPAAYLRVNNSYPFFQQFGGLVKTGPTHTNVMDLRVGLVHILLGET